MTQLAPHPPAPSDGLEHIIAVARGEEPADLVVRGGRVVNVQSGEIHDADVAIAGGRIAGFGDYRGREQLDARGLFVAPGFIDAHIHIESSMLTPSEFARAVVPLGTAAVVADPHEIANVLGLDGIRYMLDSSQDLPLTVLFMLPSCVPATPLETSGARLDASDLAPLLTHPRVLGLAEMMNYPGVLHRDRGVLEKLRLGRGRLIDGHAPGLTGKDLNAYAAAGIGSDHECTTAEEGREKLRAGMQVLIREGSVAKNLSALVPMITPLNAARCGVVTDDRHPTDLVTEGHVDHLLRRAVRLGVPPIQAMQMVTVNAASHFGLAGLGAITPGHQADLVLLEDLTDFRARTVLHRGRCVARDGELAVDLPNPPAPPAGTIHIGPVTANSLAIRAAGHRVGKLIEIVPGQIVTGRSTFPLAVRDGLAVADAARDIAKLAVVERHLGTGNVGRAFVRGFGLRAGALASTVAHDSHNVVVVGTDDADMWAAIRAVEQMHGGLVAIRHGEIIAALPLPIAGLMSDRPFRRVAAEMGQLLQAARDLGSPLRDPFMTLSFLALPVLPTLRLSDRGLIDVDAFDFVSPLGER